MTVPEACALTLRITRNLSAARADAAMYRLLAQEAMQLLHDQHVELERTKKAYYSLLDEVRELRRARPAA